MILFLLAFSLVFSAAIGVAYTLIIVAAFKKTIKPKWLLSAIFSGITLTCHFINEDYTIYSLLGFVGSLVVLGILFLVGSFVYSVATSTKKIVISNNPLWLKMLRIAIPVIFIYLFCTQGFVAFVFVAFYLVFESIVFTSNKQQFSRLQSMLPTSKIQSIAMGLVEIKGNVQMIEPLIAPLDNKECIGYKYLEESISRDDEGRKSYSTDKTEQRCNRFYMEDETGKVLVVPDKMEMVWMKLDARLEQHSKRYSQWLLLQDSKMLLVGKASLEGNDQVIVHEEIKNVFAIAPVDAVNKWNRNTPLRRSASAYALLFAFLAAIILLAPIYVENNRVILKITKEMFFW